MLATELRAIMAAMAVGLGRYSPGDLKAVLRWLEMDLSARRLVLSGKTAIYRKDTKSYCVGPVND